MAVTDFKKSRRFIPTLPASGISGEVRKGYASLLWCAWQSNYAEYSANYTIG
jgi:hypothetical protein